MAEKKPVTRKYTKVETFYRTEENYTTEDYFNKLSLLTDEDLFNRYVYKTGEKFSASDIKFSDDIYAVLGIKEKNKNKEEVYSYASLAATIGTPCYEAFKKSLFWGHVQVAAMYGYELNLEAIVKDYNALISANDFLPHFSAFVLSKSEDKLPPLTELFDKLGEFIQRGIVYSKKDTDSF